ncbi:hypothetical protein ATY61_004603 [Salmonella enterica subsp. enterica serovar Saintpaul]|nr:hypothetical protein [Salmonella enterica subsp. enterica serovar Saintpaul]
MKSLITLAALAAAIVATPASAVMVRTVLIAAQVETNMMCLAGYDGDSMEKALNFLDSVRWEKGPEGDQIPHDQTYINFFEGVDHNGYWAGKDLKKEGYNRDSCGGYTIEYIRGLAHKLNADDFIKMNPQVFGESK